MSYSIKIAHIYPDLLNMYGDRGNIASLTKRLQWRNIECTVEEISSGSSFSPDEYDILFLGGGSEKAESSALKNLLEYKSQLKEYIENDGVFLAVCGGYPMLGKYILNGTEKNECLDLIDIYTEKTSTRFTGNKVITNDTISTIVGFENHGTKTFIGDLTPLGKDAEGNFEGVIYKNLFATYFHGPLLPKNPKLTDEILTRALSKKYGESITLPPLDDTLELNAHNYMINN